MPLNTILIIVGLLCIVLVVSGRVGEAQNIIVGVILLVVLFLLLRWAGVL